MDQHGPGYIPNLIASKRQIGSREFDFARQVAIVGIVNRTPNSFHDQGRTYELGRAIEAVERVASEGADWVDIGGLAFRHDQVEITEREEIERVVPLVEAAKDRTDLVVSVDTHRTEVARAVLSAGADVINDTFGLRTEGMAEAIAEAGASVVIVHSIGGPRKLISQPTYSDVVHDVRSFLVRQTDHAIKSGIPVDRIIIDPGHDLNKNTFQSLELTERLREITALGYPTFVAVSNKDFIGETLDLPQAERLEGTIAANVFCIMHGARMIRVHDVEAGRRAATMTEAMLGLRGPLRARHNL